MMQGLATNNNPEALRLWQESRYRDGQRESNSSSRLPGADGGFWLSPGSISGLRSFSSNWLMLPVEETFFSSWPWSSRPSCISEIRLPVWNGSRGVIRVAAWFTALISGNNKPRRYSLLLPIFWISLMAQGAALGASNSMLIWVPWLRTCRNQRTTAMLQGWLLCSRTPRISPACRVLGTLFSQATQ